MENQPHPAHIVKKLTTLDVCRINLNADKAPNRYKTENPNDSTEKNQKPRKCTQKAPISIF